MHLERNKKKGDDDEDDDDDDVEEGEVKEEGDEMKKDPVYTVGIPWIRMLYRVIPMNCAKLFGFYT